MLVNTSVNLSLMAGARTLLAWVCLAVSVPAVAYKAPKADVSLPNGTLRVTATDLAVYGAAGRLVWDRDYYGGGWRFNAQWSSLAVMDLRTEQTYVGSAGTQQCDASTCWRMLDADWLPSAASGGYYPAAAGQPARVKVEPVDVQPFNWNIQPDPANLVTKVLRSTQLYEGSDGDNFFFKKRYSIRRQPVPVLPRTDTLPGAQPTAPAVQLSAALTDSGGFRWQDLSGQFAEYDAQGLMSRWGDRNGNAFWIQRNARGQVERVIDGGNGAASGPTLLTLQYDDAGYLTHVRDVPQAWNPLDLPQRTVVYRYSSLGQLESVTDARGNEWRYQYDGRNRLEKSTDPEGRETRYTYDGESRSVAAVTAADGGVTDYRYSYDDNRKVFYTKVYGPQTEAGRRLHDFTHDREGELLTYELNARTDLSVTRDRAARTEQLTDARGLTTTLVRDEFEQITQVSFPDSSKVLREYEPRHLNPVLETDEIGIRTRLDYDDRGNLRVLTLAQGTSDQRVTEFSHDTAGRVLTRKALGRVEWDASVTPDSIWTFVYDAAGNLAESTDPEGHVRKYVFDRAGNLAQYQDARGHVRTATFDAHGGVALTKDARGKEAVLQRDRIGNLVRLVDERQKVWRWGYDARNRLTSATHPLEGTERTEYDLEGRPVRWEDADGVTARLIWDNFSRLAQTVDGLGNVTTYRYEIPDGQEAGKLASTLGPARIDYPTYSVEAKYDLRDRPLLERLIYQNRDGVQTVELAVEYDLRGLPIRSVDGYGKSRSMAYDALGQAIGAIDALNHAVTLHRDARGNVIAFVDANGKVYKFAHDRNDQLRSETLPLGQVTRYAYDAEGNLDERIDPRAVKTGWVHDQLNRPVEQKQWAPSGEAARTTRFDWNDTGNLTGWQDSDLAGGTTSASEIAIDDAGRKIGETVTWPDGFQASWAYRYTLAGRKSALVLPGGREIGYGYSGHGQVNRVTFGAEGEINVTEFRWTRPARTLFPGGATREQAYDGLLNLESVSVGRPGDPPLHTLQNSFGRASELRGVVRLDRMGALARTWTSEFRYDDEIRLVRSSIAVDGGPDDVQTFTLDPAGNRIAHSRLPGPWQYDGNNRLLKRGADSGEITQEFDDAGNLTLVTGASIEPLRYVHDTLNRLTGVQSGAGEPRAQYGYDPFDRRLWRDASVDEEGAPLAAARRTYFIHAEEGPVGIASRALSEPVASAGLSEVAVPLPDGLYATEWVAASKVGPAGGSDTHFFQYDASLAPTVAVDRDARLVGSLRLDPFGSLSSADTASDVHVPTTWSTARYAGQRYDAVARLSNNWRRHYDASTGRFVQSDPLGLAGGVNAFGYVSGDPLNAIDPTGEFLQFLPWVGAAAGGIALGGLLDWLVGDGCYTLPEAALDAGLGLAGIPLAKLAGKLLPALPRLIPKRPIPGGGAAGPAGEGLAGKGVKPDFIVSPDGAVAHGSPEKVRAALEGAGFQGTAAQKTAETGTIHNIPGMKMDIRVMNGGANHPARVVTSRQGTSQPVNPVNGKNFGNVPKSEQNARSHIVFP